MKFIDEFRDPGLSRRLADKIAQISTRPARLMEFCGGHTVAIMRNGIRQLLPPHIEMLSGPGCPVCVTANRDIDRAIALSQVPGLIITTFGDMLKVPGSYSSLQQARAAGGDIRIVYSTQDALQAARVNPDRLVVFLGVGFETTAPTVASAVLQAEREKIDNFYILCHLKMTPPAMRALLELGETHLNGIICPGHVSTIIGTKPYQAYARDYGVACVVAGFEPVDILQAVEMLVQQIEDGIARVDIAYTRGVRPEGNIRAQDLMNDVFDTTDACWRGIGDISKSGLSLKNKYNRYDAARRFEVELPPVREHAGCRCGEILRGVIRPVDCGLFGKACTPENPVGPCMVSSEGSCAAYYQYGAHDG
ncbi:MAG: hydrogenase formation protein HypD [Dehalococcoidia bacterium]|nr:hydrogenase formation protein HypD [Dehalococcoidia bacterium]MDD5648090.1 hydrogenase formation protein HypD [Dehalococcoidia bacterium]